MAQEANKERADFIKNQWEKLTETYAKVQEINSVQFTTGLAVQTRAQDATTILETACGSGLSALSIVPFLKKGASYYCTDISNNMLKLLKKRFEEADFSHNPNNVLEYSEEFSTEKLKVQPREGLTGLHIKALPANSEALPFADESFDAYFSNFSLHQVDNVANVIHEAFRVLKKGGIAGFTAIGRKSHTNAFDIFNEVVEKYGIKGAEDRTKICIGDRLEEFEKTSQEAGFTKVRSWFTLMVNIQDAKSAAAFERSAFMNKEKNREAISVFSEEKREEIFEEIYQRFKTRFDEGKEVQQVDVFYLICRKD
jgi:ubiquinone/menaquinone biosynthesis C-methylase UbiE